MIPENINDLIKAIGYRVADSGAVFDAAIATRVVIDRTHLFFTEGCATDNCVAHDKADCAEGCALLNDWEDADIIELVTDSCVSLLITMDPKNEGKDSIGDSSGFWRLMINPEARRYFIRRYRGDS